MLKRLLAWLSSKITNKPTNTSGSTSAGKSGGKSGSKSGTKMRGKTAAKPANKAAAVAKAQPNQSPVPRPKPGTGYTVEAINNDELSASAKAAFARNVADDSGLPLFTGKINHAYDLAEVDDAKVCPRCSAPTGQQYANWVYATDSTPRALVAPAGYFCTKCPTVVIDQKMLRQGVTRGFRYVQVIGLTNENAKGFHGFTTWNGAKPTYLFDEAGNPGGFADLDKLSPEEKRQYLAQQNKTKTKRLKVKRNR